jgi:DNA-binding CsgD family transcriptional regulator
MHVHVSTQLRETVVTERLGRCVCSERRMEKLSRATLRKARAVEDALAHYSLDGDNVLASVEALGELLETDSVILYSLAQRAGHDDLMVTRAATIGRLRERWRGVFDDFLVGRGVTFGIYNAIQPEPAQRDRVLRSEELAVVTEGRSVEIEGQLHRRMGTVGDDIMRVLVCDGPSMLAWVGIVQPEKTTERQRDLLNLVLPAFRRRLRFERRVDASVVAAGALATALEDLGGAAWVLGPTGDIVIANSAGRAKLDRDRATTRATIAACAAGTGPAQLEATPLRDHEGHQGHLVVEIPDPAALGGGLSSAALRFGLTPAQTRVLERVARGISNATIAAELGVAERTIEAHVTAILVKAQVPSRAALIVQVFRGG